MDTVERKQPIRLVVAAESREFRGILRNCGPVKGLSWPIAVSISAELNGVRYVFAANGPGPRLAGRVLEVAEVQAGKTGIETVISTGFCGGLDPQLALGDIVEATSVVDLDTGNQYDATPVRTGSARLRGLVLSSDRVAGTIEDKARLRSRSADASAIEMEASAVGSWARARSIPFYCVRVVSDRAGDAFPMDMNLLRDREGRFDRLRIARQGLVKPWTRIPGLLKLDRDCRVAEDKLGEFFANCRFD
jgi:adenosylhomocysteine nucleosidase